MAKKIKTKIARFKKHYNREYDDLKDMILNSNATVFQQQQMRLSLNRLHAYYGQLDRLANEYVTAIENHRGNLMDMGEHLEAKKYDEIIDTIKKYGKYRPTGCGPL